MCHFFNKQNKPGELTCGRSPMQVTFHLIEEG